MSRFVGQRAANFIIVGGTRAALRAFDLLLISLVMQLVLALPMAWYFHRLTVLSLAANVLALPLAAIVLPAALIALCLAFVVATLGIGLLIAPAISSRHAGDHGDRCWPG